MCTDDITNDLYYGEFIPVMVPKHDTGLYEPEIIDYDFTPVVVVGDS